MTSKDARTAFNDAIATGLLSADVNEPNYAGNYMYMGTTATNVDMFKHISTRQYLNQ